MPTGRKLNCGGWPSPPLGDVARARSKQLGEDEGHYYHLACRLHTALRDFRPPTGFGRRQWDRHALLETTVFAGTMEEIWQLVPAEHREKMRDHIAWADEQVDAAWTSEPVALIHADLHLSKVIVTADGSVGVIDFDDTGFGPRLYDFAASVSTPDELNDATYARYFGNVRRLVEGYASIAPPPAPLLDLDDPMWRGMTAARQLTVALWTASRAARRDDWIPILHDYAARTVAFVDRLRVT